MKKLSLLLAAFAMTATAWAQPKTNKKGSQMQFTVVKEAKVTSVKNQYHSSTCWIYSTESFLESEFMRQGKGEVDLSEMWLVRCGYIEKAKKYMRMMGRTQFAPGGEPHDVINLAAQYGLMPQSAYPGMPQGETKPKHNEMDEVLKAILDAQLKLHEGKLSPNWLNAFIGALDGYLGVPPKDFNIAGTTYTPKSYAAFLGFNADDYVAVTSYTHHPFYSKFPLEIPDNWAWGMMQNVPMEEMKSIADNALMNGYTVAWGADVSEQYFSHKNGLAIVPEKSMDDMRAGEKDSLWILPVKEMTITQQLRQEAFDNLSTQDDHGMQLTGIVKDQTGKKYYIVKNSWGTERNEMGGYFYCSESYFNYKTVSILVHKNAVPADVAKKIGLK
ncbi:MAG: C1 family peptidase [Bacteroidia bacterium]